MILDSILKRTSTEASNTAVQYNGESISYGQFSRAILDTAEYLKVQAPSTGGVMIVCIYSLLDCWTAVIALQALGHNTVAVGSAQTIDTLELDGIAGIVTTEGEAPFHQISSVQAATGVGVIAVPSPAYSSDSLPTAPNVERFPDPGSHILYTSGTTGNFKKIFASAESQPKRDEERIQSMDISTDTFFHCFDFGLWTAVGYFVAPAVWRAGGCIILDQRPDWHQWFPHSGVTRAIMLPDKLSQLLESVSGRTDLSMPMNFRLYASGGFISRGMARKIIDRLTTGLIISYGSTEVSIASLQSPVENLDDLHWLAPTQLRSIEIVDEAGKLCAVDCEGQLRIRLEAQDCPSYMDAPQASETVFKHGYFYPGDMAVERADGRVRILGRSADVINFGGQKQSVAPMEEKITTFLDVKNTCLFSGINRAGEEEVVVALESEEWPEDAKLDSLRSQFGRFERMRVAKVCPFPRTQTGTNKINRIALRKTVFPDD